MLFHLHIPHPPLHDYVENMIYHKGYNPAHTIDRLLPDGTVNLIIDLGDEPKHIYDNDTLAVHQSYKGAWISGIQQRFISISTGQNSEMVVVRFQPGGCFPFLGMPMMELKDQVVDATLIFGPDITSLRDQMLEADDAMEKLRMAEQWLWQRLTIGDVQEAVVRFAVDRIHHQPSLARLQTLAAKSGYSQKQFIYLFKKHVGATPKAYQRIVRFNRVLSDIRNEQRVHWTQLALDCGFFDQAHFIKEFKEFAGMNPKKYLQERGAFIHYIAVN